MVQFDPERQELRIRLEGQTGEEAYQTFLFLGQFLKDLHHVRLRELGAALATEMNKYEIGRRFAPPPDGAGQPTGLQETLQRFINLAAARGLRR